MRKDVIEIQIEAGIIKLRRPKAGDRNQALLESNNNEFLMIMKLIPKLVVEHPFGHGVVIEQGLDNLEIQDYDKIVMAMKEFIGISGDEIKKSERPSGEEQQKA